MLSIPFDASQVARIGERLPRFRNQTSTTNQDSRDVAMTSNRYFIDYSTSERLALYDYAIQEAKKRGFVQFKSAQEVVDTTSLYEANNQTEATSRLASERARVRPRSYQTNKAKTHTEVLRELISSQMEHLMTTSGRDSSDNAEASRMGHSSRSSDDATNSENANNKRHRSDSSSSKNRSYKKSK